MPNFFDYRAQIAAVLVFLAGFISSQIVERRKRLRESLVHSAKALLTLLSLWQELLVDLIYAAYHSEPDGLNSSSAVKRFVSKRGIAEEIDHHLSILEQDPRAKGLVAETRALFKAGPETGGVAQALSARLFHGLQGNLAHIRSTVVITNGHIKARLSDNWIFDPALKSFEDWAARVFAETARFVSAV